MMALAMLVERLERAGLVLETKGRIDNIDIDHLAHDSRTVGPNGLFVALRGDTFDGHLFIDKAVQNGASAVVCEVMPAEVQTRFPGIAFIHVRQTRRALAEVAAAFYGDPSRQLTMIGVTGTNGKTTTAVLVQHLLDEVGRRAGLISTIEYDTGQETTPASRTTPDALDLQQLLRQMVDGGCAACSMEVSSHALAQERVHGIDYDVAVFTNLTRDHLDYHDSFDAYREAKKKLFDALPAEAVALYNADDPSGERIVADTSANVQSYGQSEEVDLRVEILANRIDGLRLRIDGSERSFRLVGSFNAYNLLAAYGVGRALGHPEGEVLDVLAEAPPVPGRFERFLAGDGTAVIVDYAHTPDALANVLQTMRETKPDAAAVWCVFGCGGDRDRTKRGVMGRIAESYAEHVIVTSDNPRTEPQAQIMHDIRSGMDRPDEALWIEDRRAAIRDAIGRAAPEDVVLIAGKGHEPYQIIGTEQIPLDDREEVRKSIEIRTSKDD